MNKKQHNKRVKTIIWTIAAIAVVAICGGGAIAYLTIKETPAIEEPVRIYIPAGASPEQMQDSLDARLGEKYGQKVMWLWRAQGGKAPTAHGSYLIDPSTSALSLSRKLKYGRQTPVKLVINSVRTMPQLSERVASKLEFMPADFLNACDSILGAESAPQEYMSYFLPDSYEFYWTASPQHVVSTLVRVHDRFWNDQRLQQASKLHLSPSQVATLASIVEEETAKADELPRVARLYLNRLAKGMKLQADPTVKFAVGDFTLRRILNAHLQTESPYNTYLYPGLPPGPIRMASQQGIDAVLQAPQHNYLYMCAKEDFSGYHNFAATYPEHQANARRYQAQLNKRGIK